MADRRQKEIAEYEYHADRKSRSRRQNQNRGKERLMSLVAMGAGVLLLAGIGTGIYFGVRTWRGNQTPEITVNKGREITKETFPAASGGNPAVGGSGYRIQGGTSSEQAIQLLSQMTLEEKVAQLFLVTPEALTGYDLVTAAGAATKSAVDQYPVGGLVYFKENLVSPSQVKDLLFNTRKYSQERIVVPVFTSVDEEGGSVARIGSQPDFAVTQLEDMRTIGDSGDSGRAYEAGKVIGGYLSDLGFNLDFAPVADVLSNPENTVVSKRSFGTDAAVVAKYSKEVVKGLEEQGVSAVIKHYPGHGATSGDTHEGYAFVDKTLEELMSNELIPFQAGIDAGVDFVMVAHISVPKITGNDEPSTLSKTMVTDILREKMGFQRIIVTDAMNMKAITDQYTPGEAAVKALAAGVDMIVMPQDFKAAYQGVLDAVQNNTLTEERINDSVRRILEVKFRKLK